MIKKILENVDKLLENDITSQQQHFDVRVRQFLNVFQWMDR